MAEVVAFADGFDILHGNAVCVPVSAAALFIKFDDVSSRFLVDVDACVTIIRVTVSVIKSAMTSPTPVSAIANLEFCTVVVSLADSVALIDSHVVEVGDVH